VQGKEKHPYGGMMYKERRPVYTGNMNLYETQYIEREGRA
jgi:hypothetical protein